MNQPDWQHVRTATSDAAERCGQLLSDLTAVRAAATDRWTTVDVGAHLVTVAMITRSALPGTPGPHPFPELAEHIGSAALQDLAALNELLLARYTERDPKALARDLTAEVHAVVGTCAELPPDTVVTWFGGARLPLSAALAHLLNEILIHGRDIAAAVGAPWAVSDRDSAAIFTFFLLRVFGPRTEPGAVVSADRVAVEFRSAHTDPVVLVHSNDGFSVEPPGATVDAHLRFAPAAFLLMLFGRIRLPRAVIAGRMMVWGRRPWRLGTLLGAVYIP